MCGPCTTVLYITGQSIGSASHNTFVLIDGILGTILAGSCLDMVWFCGHTELDSITDYVEIPHYVYCLS